MTLFAFKAGHDAVIRSAPCLSAAGKALVGEDVNIHYQLTPQQTPPHYRVHPSGSDAPFYAISTRDGVRGILCGHCLAPKPDNAHTWAGIEALSGWRPPASTTATSTTGNPPEGGAA